MGSSLHYPMLVHSVSYIVGETGQTPHAIINNPYLFLYPQYMTIGNIFFYTEYSKLTCLKRGDINV